MGRAGVQGWGSPNTKKGSDRHGGPDQLSRIRCPGRRPLFLARFGQEGLVGPGRRRVLADHRNAAVALGFEEVGEILDTKSTPGSIATSRNTHSGPKRACRSPCT